MTSLLLITKAEKVQSEINAALKSFEGYWGLYVSLNKPYEATEDRLKKADINTANTFFIDCVKGKQLQKGIMHIKPHRPELLQTAIQTFIKEIPRPTFIVIDSLATLLIYNSEKMVVRFVKAIVDTASDNGITLIAFSPRTEDEELLNKIFNFFDNVDKR